MRKSSRRLVTTIFMGVTLCTMSMHSIIVNAKQSSGCEATPKVLSHTSLSGLANFWFGSPDFRFAIMTATNTRAGDAKFSFISNPNQLPVGTDTKANHVCIPEIAEAERLKLRFDSYLNAVNDMALAEPSEVVDDLDRVPTSGPVTVVSWVRADQAESYPDKPSSAYISTGNMWVTLAPHLQEFCREFVDAHSKNPDHVTLRLEQRLGLPPAAAKTHFIELVINTPADGQSLFRPCGDTSVTTTTCALSGPASCNIADQTCHQRADFFYQQYYSSYGSARPVEYPWTSLGYTFDWGYKEVGLGGKFDYVQVGESEYVVPPDTTMKFVGKYTTAEYCGLN